MTIKKTLTTSGILMLASLGVNAATFTVGGGSFAAAAFNDSSGTELSTSSIIQVGYFNGVDVNTDPATYTPADWNTFTAISGINSLNPGKITDTNGPAEGLGLGTYSLNLTYDTDTDNVPGSYPVRFGIRVFNSTTSTGAGVQYNTVTTFEPGWRILSAPTDTIPGNLALSLFGVDDPGSIAWEDGGANEFRTTLTMVPEPSSISLLGLAMIGFTLRRRR